MLAFGLEFEHTLIKTAGVCCWSFLLKNITLYTRVGGLNLRPCDYLSYVQVDYGNLLIMLVLRVVFTYNHLLNLSLLIAIPLPPQLTEIKNGKCGQSFPSAAYEFD